MSEKKRKPTGKCIGCDKRTTHTAEVWINTDTNPETEVNFACTECACSWAEATAGDF